MEGTCGYRGRQCVLISVVAFALIITPQLVSAEVITFQGGFLGHLQHYQVKKKESLIEIARKFDLGFNAMMVANPGIDPFVPEAGTVLTIPTAWILPAVTSRPCVVINLPEFRLYYLPKPPSDMVLTFPLGIGDQGTDTPVGSYHVVEKIVRPAWHVPASIRKQEPFLPKVMPPGPENPMGSHALRLSSHDILIHGTNRPWGIGRRSSHGCLRLYPEDIVTLFRVIHKGTRVVIIDQPVKIATKGSRVYLEAHRKDRVVVTIGEVVQKLATARILGRADFAKLIRAMEERRGIPVDITLDFIDGKGDGGKLAGPAGLQPAPKRVRNREAP